MRGGCPGFHETWLDAADFDSPEGNADTLRDTLFYPTKKTIAGNASPEPLPLEGSLAAGDSGSGIWAELDGRYYLIGIASFRMYSCYGAQAYYVNLGNPEVAAWILSVCPEAEIAGILFLQNHEYMCIKRHTRAGSCDPARVCPYRCKRRSP